jgi:hypothetical protein
MVTVGSLKQPNPMLSLGSALRSQSKRLGDRAHEAYPESDQGGGAVQCGTVCKSECTSEYNFTGTIEIEN